MNRTQTIALKQYIFSRQITRKVPKLVSVSPAVKILTLKGMMMTPLPSKFALEVILL